MHDMCPGSPRTVERMQGSRYAAYRFESTPHRRVGVQPRAAISRFAWQTLVGSPT
jgi:hypothetical protein